jgi:hypothetical protein
VRGGWYVDSAWWMVCGQCVVDGMWTVRGGWYVDSAWWMVYGQFHFHIAMTARGL